MSNPAGDSDDARLGFGLDAFGSGISDDVGGGDDGVEGMILGLTGGAEPDWQLAALEDFSDVPKDSSVNLDFLDPPPDVKGGEERLAEAQEAHQARLAALQKAHLSQQQHLQGQQRAQEMKEIALHNERMARIGGGDGGEVVDAAMGGMPDVSVRALAAAGLATASQQQQQHQQHQQQQQQHQQQQQLQQQHLQQQQQQQPVAAACPTTASACRYCGRPFGGSASLRKHEGACRRARAGSGAGAENPSSSSSVPGTPATAIDGTDSDVHMASPAAAVASLAPGVFSAMTRGAFGGSGGSLDGGVGGGGRGESSAGVSGDQAGTGGMRSAGGSACGLAGPSLSAGAAGGGSGANKRDSDLIHVMRRLETAISGLDISARLCLRDALISLSNKAANPHLQPTPEQEALNRAAEYLVLRMLFLSGQQVPHSAPGTAPLPTSAGAFHPGFGGMVPNTAPGGLPGANLQSAGLVQLPGGQGGIKNEPKLTGVKRELEHVRGMSPANSRANGNDAVRARMGGSAPPAPSGMSPGIAAQEMQSGRPLITSPPAMDLETGDLVKRNHSNVP